MLTPQTTYIALLIVQALHLPHHRLAKRPVSFAEVIRQRAVRAALNSGLQRIFPTLKIR